MSINQELQQLSQALHGELHYDDLHKKIYATDASVYRKIPLAVVYPKDKNDLKKLISFATQNKVSLVPRTAGTSLAGQCVGEGIIVDTSKYLPEGFDAYANPNGIEGINYMDENDTIVLEFNAKDYLPEAFNPYAKK